MQETQYELVKSLLVNFLESFTKLAVEAVKVSKVERLAMMTELQTTIEEVEAKLESLEDLFPIQN